MEGSNSFERLRDLELTRDEMDRLGQAMKKEEFRKLLAEYVSEIQDPENKKQYEIEITQLEKERGNDITFLHPTPCYVIKTSVNGNKKGFINICANEHVNKPSSSGGIQWTIPHSMAPPSEDIDNKGVRCKVYDVLFHPDTLHLATKNDIFKNMVNNTACSSIEKNYDVKLDKKNLKFPKMKYKGMARASIIRKPTAEGPIERSPEEKAFFDKLYAQADESTQSYKSPKKSKKSNTKTEDEKSPYTTPKYIIKHRRHVEMEEFTENKESKLFTATPKELIVEVNLPLIKSANDINLDVTEKTVQLISEKPAKYKLNVSLPYQVDQDKGNAKFEKDLKMLMITLPVKRKLSTFPINDFMREDSGVESDHGSPVSMESEEEFSEKSLVSGIMSESSVKSVPQFRTKFLDEKVHYTIPEFTCHVFENIIAFTLNVKNVDEESLSKLIDENSKSVHVKFVSISPSFYQLHYAFMVKLPVKFADKNLITVEVWDNNVILQIPFENCDKECSSYLYGLCQEELQEKYVEEPHILNAIYEQHHILNSIREEPESNQELNNNEKSVSHDSVNYDSDDEVPANSKLETQNSIEDETNDFEDGSSRNMNIATSYESSGDELSCSYSPCRSRGILKRYLNRKSFSRSISESSLDDCIGSLGYESVDSAIPEDNEASTEMSTSLKKTVRFNDVVSRQLYRFNSSILGQKKKNQRKAQKKKKAQGRRNSESEASEVEDRKEDEDHHEDHQTQSNCDLRNEDNVVEKSSKRDENIFHLDM